MFETLLQSSYFALFLIIALGFMLGRIQIKGLSLDVSAVIFIALLYRSHPFTHQDSVPDAFFASAERRHST